MLGFCLAIDIYTHIYLYICIYKLQPPIQNPIPDIPHFQDLPSSSCRGRSARQGIHEGMDRSTNFS